MKRFLLAIALLALPSIAIAQTPPSGPSGPGPQPSPWIINGPQISYSQGCVLVPVTASPGCHGVGTISSNGVFVGPSSSAGASFNISQGSAPLASNPGDVWITTGGLFVNINGTVTQLGGVGAGTINNLAYYAATGTNISPLATLANGVLTTNASGVPAIVAPGSTLTLSSGVLGCTTMTGSQIGCAKPDGTTIVVSGGIITAVGAVAAAIDAAGATAISNGTVNNLLYDSAGKVAVATITNFLTAGTGITFGGTPTNVTINTSLSAGAAINVTSGVVSEPLAATRLGGL